MKNKSFLKLQTLCKKYFDQAPQNATQLIYCLAPSERASKSLSLNRIGGSPIGIDQLPDWQGVLMRHIFTLDLQTVPLLQEKYWEYRALAFFMYNKMNDSDAQNIEEAEEENENEWENDDSWNEEDNWLGYERKNNLAYANKLLFLTEEDLAKGEFAAPHKENQPPIEIDVQEIFVPLEIFELRSDHTDKELHAIRKALLKVPAYVLGQALEMWGNSPTDFLMQFNEEFAYVDLGKADIMYMTEKKCFWNS